LALVEALLLASLELLLLRLLLLLLLLLVGKEVPTAKTIKKWQSKSAMNCCKRCNGLTFLKISLLNLHEKMSFKNAVSFMMSL
jgi:hypothetical protein